MLETMGSTRVFDLAGGDEPDTWQMGLLRFGNQFAAVCYAHGICLQLLHDHFTEIFSPKHHYQSVQGINWPSYEDFKNQNYDHVSKQILTEILDPKRWDWHDLPRLEKYHAEGRINRYFSNYDIYDQIEFVRNNSIRRPNKVLEIGGGRGEVANVFEYLGSACTSLEPGLHADQLYAFTAKLFFGKTFPAVSPITIDLKNFTQKYDFDQFDTIVFCESIEHVTESEFWSFWQKICAQFHGMIIIVNWLYYHPIPVSPPGHIFEINDAVYDCLVNDSKRCLYRNHSHLILEM